MSNIDQKARSPTGILTIEPVGDCEFASTPAIVARNGHFVRSEHIAHYRGLKAAAVIP